MAGMLDRLTERKTLYAACERVRDNGGCRGADGMTVDDLEDADIDASALTPVPSPGPPSTPAPGEGRPQPPGKQGISKSPPLPGRACSGDRERGPGGEGRDLWTYLELRAAE